MAYRPVCEEIKVNGLKITEVVYVADITDDAILGWDAQVALGVRYEVAGIDLAGATRRVGKINQAAIIRRVRATEDCVIPPRHEVVITGQLEPSRPGGATLIHCLNKPAEGEGLVIAR